MHYRIKSYEFGEKQQQMYNKLDLPHEMNIKHVRIKEIILSFFLGNGKKHTLVHVWYEANMRLTDFFWMQTLPCQDFLLELLFDSK